jgi:hypothetical protein|nr:MAG: hypothetical protein J07AB56_13110 [Candidatus Nanosalinarum sp. J07AB56]
MISSIADEGRIVVLTSHMIDEMQHNCNKYGLVHGGNFVEPRVVDETISNNNYAGIKPFLEDAFAL